MIETRWPLNGNPYPDGADDPWMLIVRLGEIIARQDQQLKEHAARIAALEGRGRLAEPQFSESLMSDGRVLRHHTEAACTGDCCLHGTSAHLLCRLPTTWRSDRLILEHRCFHGVGHPCPGTLGDTTHGCCAERCCSDD